MHQRKGAYFKSKNLTHIPNRFIRILTLLREKKTNSRNINVWDAGHSHPIFMRGIPVQTKTMRFLANQTCVRNPDQRAKIIPCAMRLTNGHILFLGESGWGVREGECMFSRLTWLASLTIFLSRLSARFAALFFALAGSMFTG